MMKRSLIVLVMCIVMNVLPAWGLDFKPGKYEINVKVEMEGVPGGMPGMAAPHTITQCLSESDPVPSATVDAKGCEIQNMQTKGDTISYDVVCKQQGMETKSTGEMTYNGDIIEGINKTTMGPSAGGMTITTKIKGKRIGECE
ncbi:MAG: DUF3617 family protein [Desulfobacteraceae bacterium]